MIKQVSKSLFVEQFNDVRPNSFSYDALGVLYDHLEEVAPDLELDIIAIDCDFCEYNTFEELQADYPDVESPLELHDHTTVIDVPGGGYVIGVF